MDTDYIELGVCAPIEENCTQVSSKSDYMPRMRIEARVFKNMLNRLFPVPDGSYGYLKIKSNPHDFGSYLDIVVVFDASDPVSADWAYGIEANVPEYWDDIARQELMDAGYYAAPSAQDTGLWV